MFVAVRPTAKSLVLELLSTLRRGSMPVRALVAAGALFGIAENSIRVALARLYAAGSVERDERGRYRLGRGSEAVRGQVGSWRRLEERRRPWSGGWVGLHRPSGGADRERARALRWLGFAALEPELALRPDNLEGGVAGVRERLAALGQGAGALVFGLRELDPTTELRARRLWDADALARACTESRRELEQSRARLAGLSLEEAMVETFLLGGRVLRQLVLDPLLPEEIAPAAPRRDLLDAMVEYDRLGRACWAPFLERFDVPHRHTPANLASELRSALQPELAGEEAASGGTA
jgi:phenylacetic acid degradation operon negative regulatory protein